MISEVTAPDGFFNQGELKKVVVEPNKTIEVTLDNKPQKGQLTLIKKGKVPVGLEKKETDYGDLYVSEVIGNLGKNTLSQQKIRRIG
ncbi:hypothetical protein [Listeria welshimeri]|uniref:hypothetical protein n=1 Tax=Listeria welshimeri TaxID=1643 RepID=UPI001E6055CF|nr:hypothetical protein [Listeria welshimeri]